jgi:hypothetical protein
VSPVLLLHWGNSAVLELNSIELQFVVYSWLIIAGELSNFSG